MDGKTLNQQFNWPEMRQRVYELYQLGWEQDQIVQTLGIPEGAVRHWLQHAQEEETQRATKIAEHFRLPSEQNFHWFWDVPDSRIIQRRVARAAEDLGFHLAILKGAQIDNKRTLLMTLGDLYEFPKFPNYEYETWDGAYDWLRDLTWLTESPPDSKKVRGFLLLYLDPLSLFLADLYSFALFLDIVGDSAVQHQKNGLPFHSVIGPVDGKMHSFVNTLKVSERACPLCPAMLL